MPPSIPILAYRGIANHCLCAACLFDACCRLLQFSLQVSDLPVQALYKAIVKSSCGDLITTSAVAIQMGQERSASHVSRQPHKSRVLPAYSVQLQRSTTNTHFACVSHRAVSATLHTSTQSDCVSPLRRPNSASTNTQFQLRRHLRRSTALR